MNLLIILPNNIRDISFALPALQRIKAHYESVFISVIANNVGKHLLDFTQCYDEVILWSSKLSGSKAFWFLKKKVKLKKYDYVISFSPDLSLPTSLKLLGINKIIGPITGWRSGLIFNRGIKQFREYGLKHEVEFNLELLSKIGLEYTKTDIHFELKLNDEFLKNNLVSPTLLKKYVVFATATMNQFPFWSSRNFARLISRQIENGSPINIVYLYDENEKSYNQGFMDEMVKRSEQFKSIELQLISRQSLKIDSLLKLIYDSEVVVGHNNDDIHLASLLNKKVIGLNLPLAMYSLKRIAPKSADQSKLQMLIPQVVCGEVDICSMQACPYFECMAKIEVETVFGCIKKVI